MRETDRSTTARSTIPPWSPVVASPRGQVTPPIETAPPTTPPSEASRTIAARLEELAGLLERGLVTQAEYDERRTAIIDSV